MDDFPQKLDEHTIQFVRILPGPIEEVWSYLEDSDKRAQWFARGVLPKKVGEEFEMRFKHSELSPHQAPPPDSMKEVDKNGHGSVNTLLKFEPPHLLAFTFGPQKTPHTEQSMVEIALKQEGDKVRLTLTHSKIPTRDYMKGVSGGWHAHLAVLADRVAGNTPPAFWDTWRKYNEMYEKRYAQT